ncbi:MAG TPA: hypothetical protein VFB90_06275 [Dehalococcoidia bacterium]|nr:hypothetical protein [Dehalococcoidia bacterium]
MSTKATLWLSDDFHLYREVLDDQNVYLEVRGSEFIEQIVMKIPIAAWNEMRQHTPFANTPGSKRQA